jgi:hypothetical protein
LNFRSLLQYKDKRRAEEELLKREKRLDRLNIRAAREIALRHSRGQASTEDLRQAFTHYRELFDDLLERHLTERP